MWGGIGRKEVARGASGCNEGVEVLCVSTFTREEPSQERGMHMIPFLTESSHLQVQHLLVGPSFRATIDLKISHCI